MGLKGMLAYRDIADSPINIFLKKTKFKKSNRKKKKGKTPKKVWEHKEWTLFARGEDRLECFVFEFILLRNSVYMKYYGTLLVNRLWVGSTFELKFERSFFGKEARDNQSMTIMIQTTCSYVVFELRSRNNEKVHNMLSENKGTGYGPLNGQYLSPWAACQNARIRVNFSWG